MSNDDTIQPPATDSAPTPSPSTPAVPARTRRERWRRRFFLLVATLVFLVLCARLLAHVLFPIALDRVARAYGLTATYDKLDLNLLGGDVGLWGLTFAPSEGGNPVLTASYCRGAISTLRLFQLKLRVQRVEAEDAELVIERSADGSLPLVQKLVGASTPTTAAPTGGKAEASLDSPLQIDALRLQNARARFRDAMVTPATDVTMRLDLLVRDIGSPDKPTRLELGLNSPQTLAALYVDATGQSRRNRIDADVNVRMVGLDLGPAQAYLAPLGIRPVSNDISAQAAGTLTLALDDANGSATRPASTRPTTMPLAGALRGSLKLSDLKLTADAAASASVRSLAVEARELSPGAIRIDRVALDGVRANAARSQDGLIRFAGIELGDAPALAPSTTQPTTLPARPAATQSASPTAIPLVEVDRLDVTDVRFAFDDRARSPDQRLELVMSALHVKNLTTDPAKSDAPATLSLDAAMPGVMKSASVRGTIAAASPTKRASFTLSASGITAEALKPYLAPLGIEPELADAAFACQVDSTLAIDRPGGARAGLRVADLTLSDAGRPLFGMPLIDVSDVTFDSVANAVGVDNVELRGPASSVDRERDGSLRALGFRYRAPAATAAATATATTSRPTSRSIEGTAVASMPSFRLGKLSWRGADIAVTDRTTPTELHFALNDVTADVNSLRIGGSAADRTPGTFSMAIRSPGLVDRFDVSGSATPGDGSLAFDIASSSSGITLASLRPLMASLGIEPTFQAGTFRGQAKGELRADADSVRADLHVDDLALADGADVWLSVGEAAVTGVQFDGRDLRVADVSARGPTALVTRDAAGQIAAAGIRLLNAAPATASAKPKTVASAGPTTVPATRVDLSLPIVASIGRFSAQDAKIRLRDAAVLPAADLGATASVHVSNLVLGKDAPPADFDAVLAAPGLVERAAARGTLSLAPAAQAFTVTAEATGLTGGAIEPYLPPNIAVDLAGRQAGAEASVRLTQNHAGGSALDVAIGRAAIGLPSAPAPDAALGAMHLAASRIDLPGKVIAIDELTAAGARLAVVSDDAGLHVAGVLVAPAPLRPMPPAAGRAEPVAGASIANVDALVNQAKEVVPLLTIGKLSLGADSLSFTSPALGEPIDLVGAVLASRSPIAIGGSDAADLAPIEVIAATAVRGLVDSIKADASLSPLATEPVATAKLDVSGIHGSRLAKLLPTLGETIKGDGLEGASFRAAADARFRFARRGAFGIDLSRDVAADLAVRDVRLEAPGVERPLIGVDAIRAERVRYVPARGDVTVHLLDIEKPIASVTRDAAGVHVAGLTVNLLKPTTTPSIAEAAAPPAGVPAPDAANDAPPLAAPADPNASEIGIDRLTVSGLDFVIADEANAPHTVLPVADLDVQVDGLSTRALREARPIRFSAIVAAGKVSLPPRGKDGGDYQMRDAFSEASASGNLTLVPKPKGYVRASISGLEMTAIRGIAKEFGITLGGGTFDGRLDVRMQGADTFEAKAYPTFNELRVSEVPDGPIQRTFRLPAAPDVVIATIEDADGSLSLPLTVPMRAGKLEMGPIVASAVGSIGKLVAEAMVAAPLKAGKLLGGLAGFDMSSDRTREIAPVVLTFAAGETQLDGDQLAALAKVRKMMRDDPTIEATLTQQLGDDDIAMAGRRVNPGEDDAAALTERLRARKFELQRAHAQQAAVLSVASASQNDAANEAAARTLRSTDAELKLTQDALDEALNLMQPDANRDADRRTKAGAILVADLRLRAVESWLKGSGVRGADERVRASAATFNPKAVAEGTVTLTVTRTAKK